jgi:hypothetical protein
VNPNSASQDQDLSRIVESARTHGVELDETDAVRWLSAIQGGGSGADIAYDPGAGVYGHRVTMLDFSDEDLAYFRRIAEIVGFEDEPDVETALSLSGSAAQSKIQAYPGDCDYFERINIKAPTRKAASDRLAEILRAKALSRRQGDHSQLVEVKFGSYRFQVVRDGRSYTAGSAISWEPDDIERGWFAARSRDGTRIRVIWDEVASDPGWCKLDWIVADPVRGQVANASNMLDVTWEAPDGSITALDGFVDHFFQEVYLEAESLPVFSKLVGNASPDALDEYVEALEGEVRKYISNEPKNYGKAAKRLYNIFRYNGAYAEAAYLRELFDEPTVALYQIHAAIRAVDEASQPDATITEEMLLEELDRAIVTVVDTIDGEEETEIVRGLLDLRASIADDEATDHSARVEATRQRLLNLVNSFFYEKLTAVPTISAYMNGLG